ncbi:MAG: MATE family efflux transporter [Lachnospiraceae bacterium]|nr:MATE family efflux transporter [Lachnospiraceae bacterium]MDY5742813.1 MATE family efflux transporter [Lachnospiraceae bacterium]
MFPNQAKKNYSLLTGPIGRSILSFAFPLLLGNLFQQFYNVADSLIVGNFLGNSALAAVSSSGPIIQLLVGFFNGIAMGAGVVIARYLGGGHTEKLQHTVHTAVAFGLVTGALMTLAGVFLTPYLLQMMGTPASILPQSIEYFRIYFYGSIAFVVYNVCMAVLNAVGDSRHPLYFLIIATIVNLSLDYLFIGILGCGIASAAWATVISQFVSVILSIGFLIHSKGVQRLIFSQLRIEWPYLQQILKNGLPAGFQMSIISIANVVVQSNINFFGADVVAGHGAFSRIEGFGFLPINCFSLGMSTFVSQNLGAGQIDRVKKGARFGILCSIIMAEIIGIVIFIFAPMFISAFTRDPMVIAYGVGRAHICSLFFMLLAFSHVASGILRGAGKAFVPMLVMLICWCLIRVSYICIAVRIIPHINTVSWAYPITWTLSTISFILYLKYSNWLRTGQKPTVSADLSS